MIDIIQGDTYKYDFEDIIILGAVILCAAIIYNITVPQITQ